jgi:hypothetical protein
MAVWTQICGVDRRSGKLKRQPRPPPIPRATSEILWVRVFKTLEDRVRVLVLRVFVALLVSVSAAMALPHCDYVAAHSNIFCGERSGCVRAGYLWRGSCETYDRQFQCKWDCGEAGYEYSGVWGSCSCDPLDPGCDCLLEGTPITLSDGTTKTVEAIQAGDRVLAYNETSRKMQVGEVLSVRQPFLTEFYFVINGRIRVTQNHPILVNGNWVPAGELRVGDRLTRPDGTFSPVFSVEKINQQAMVYNFQVSVQTYVADGIIVHNKEDCLVYQQH